MLQRTSDTSVSYKRISLVKWLEKFRNTFLQVRWLWNIIITEQMYQQVLSPDHNYKKSLRIRIQSIISKPLLSQTRFLFGLAPIAWFWPQLSNELTWAQTKSGGSLDPILYKNRDASGIFLCQTIKRYAKKKDATILELGCNCGRYLDYLSSLGYINLTGVDISQYALSLMFQWFPKTAPKIDIRHDLFQRFLPSLPDRSFEIVFTHGGTIETTHPSFDIVKQITRVSNKYVILYIREHEYFTRFWEYEFKKHGFVATYIIRPLENFRVDSRPDNISHTTLFVFTRIGVNLAFN